MPPTDGTGGVTQIRDASRWTTKPPAVLNVGFTHRGLGALGVRRSTLDGFPTEFRDGPQGTRAAKLGDIGESAPEHWDDGMADGDRVHLIWTIHAQTLDGVEAVHAELDEALGASVSPVASYDGRAFSDYEGRTNDRVHFGYLDGISQPRIQGFDHRARPDAQPVSPYGAFFTGHESQFEGVTFDVPEPIDLVANGTYNAFRVLEQDVFAFERLLLSAAATTGRDPEWIAAKICGRWRNGNPLVLDPDPPGRPPIDSGLRNDFGYADDHDGAVCPIGSHMRRANPRDGAVVQRASAHTRRIIRRGIPYGPPIAPGTTEPDHVPRGLLGNFMCASLVSQYEGIVYDWINLGLQHPAITGTNDPLLGDNQRPSSRFVIPMRDEPDLVVTDFPRLVRTRAAAYTFLPSLPGLRFLAGALISGGPARSASSPGDACQAGDEHLEDQSIGPVDGAPQVDVGALQQRDRLAGARPNPACGLWVSAFLAGNVEPFSPRMAAASFSPRIAAPSRRRIRWKWVWSVAMIWSGWRPAPSIRVSALIDAVMSPRSMASVRSHGGTPPASPRNGSMSAAVIRAPSP